VKKLTNSKLEKRVNKLADKVDLINEALVLVLHILMRSTLIDSQDLDSSMNGLFREEDQLKDEELSARFWPPMSDYASLKDHHDNNMLTCSVDDFPVLQNKNFVSLDVTDLGF
jgi:hypothetical protein